MGVSGCSYRMFVMQKITRSGGSPALRAGLPVAPVTPGEMDININSTPEGLPSVIIVTPSEIN